MYKGKFDQKSKQTSASVEEILAQRNAAPAKRKAAPAPAPADEPEILRPRKSAPPKAAPIPQEAPQNPEPAPMPAAAQTAEAEGTPKAKQPKKAPRVGGAIFYTLYVMFILLFLAATFLGLSWLRDWLVDYEMAQPTVKAQQVYDQIFADPDWAALYDAAGIEDSSFVDIHQYAAYMEQKVGSAKLTYQETSAGLSGGRKYLVYLGEEKVAGFTLTGGETAINITDIPNWKLGAVELYFDRDNSVRLQKLSGHTAKINGVALDDSYTIQIATTKAEDYLPEGTTGVFSCIQEVTGLMGTPTVEIFDENGQPMEVVYDAQQNLYIEQTQANTMTQEQEKLAVKAIEAYSLWMIEQLTDRSKLAQYFDPSSDTYRSIVGISDQLVIQNYNDHEFTEAVVSDYCRYSDKLYSLHITQTMNIIRIDNSIKEFPIDCTLFFHEKSEGKWLVYEMVMEDVTEPVGKVRLTFKNGDNVLYSDFVKTNATSLVIPVVSAPEGKVFSGWVREDVDEKGNTTWNLVFTPDANGNVSLPDGSSLEPMTLLPLFEDAPAVEGE